MPFKGFKQRLQEGGSCEKLSVALEKVEAARKAITGEQCGINGDYSPRLGAPVLGLGVRCSKRWAGGLPGSGRGRGWRQPGCGWEGAGLAD